MSFGPDWAAEYEGFYYQRQPTLSLYHMDLAAP
jgi:hypothetical protein